MYAREAREARESTASMPAKRVKVLLVCVRNARKYFLYAREASKITRKERGNSYENAIARPPCIL
jgi:hypothetical protein